MIVEDNCINYINHINCLKSGKEAIAQNSFLLNYFPFLDNDDYETEKCKLIKIS